MTTAQKDPAETIVLGMFTYLNIYPVYYNFRHEPLPPGIKLLTGNPAELNHAIITGDADISCMSSIEFAKHQDILQLVSELSIGAYGPVESVLLFSKYADWSQLNEKKIAITDHSATSVELLRILCKERYGINCQFIRMQQDLVAMLHECDAALIIGDTALIEKENITTSTSTNIVIFDLAEEWYMWQQLPFVFGVWAIRKDRASTVDDSGVIKQLQVSKQAGIARLEACAQEYAASHELSSEVALRYLKRFSYDLTTEEQQGLARFVQLSTQIPS